MAVHIPGRRGGYRSALIGSLAIILVGAVAGSTAALAALQAVRREQVAVSFDGADRLATAVQLRTRVEERTAASRAYFLTGDLEFLAIRDAGVAAIRTDIAAFIRDAREQDRGTLRSIAVASEALVSTTDTAVLARRARPLDGAAIWASSVRGPQEALSELASRYVSDQRKAFDAARQLARARLHRTLMLVVGIIAATLVMCAVFAVVVTRIVRRALRLQQVEDEAQTFEFLEHVPAGVFILSGDGRPYYANRAATELLGRGIVGTTTPDDLASTYAAFAVGTDQPYPVAEMPVVRALAGESTTVSNMEIRRETDVVPLIVHGAPILRRDGTVAYAIAAFQDVRDLRRLALRDQLTGLANRHAAHDEFVRHRDLCERNRQQLAVALLDVDRFKSINDRFGHGAGDDVLRRLAELLLRVLRPTDVVARWGGEEIVALLPGAKAEGGVLALNRVLGAVRRESFSHLATTFAVTFSAGVVTVRADEGLTTAVARADALLYRAKTEGRDRVIGE